MLPTFQIKYRHDLNVEMTRLQELRVVRDHKQEMCDHEASAFQRAATDLQDAQRRYFSACKGVESTCK
jgi:hypothetical protein